jgi:nucleotide-binding universal stress UspA family protein
VVQFEKVLVPVDFSENSHASLQYAVEFARRHNSRLILLHVVEPAVYPVTDGLTGLASVSIGTDEDTAETRLRQWKKDEVPPEVKTETALRTGSAYHEITEAARDLDADLIIISTHGYTGLKHVLLGSTAERVVRHASCPVLTLRQP